MIAVIAADELVFAGMSRLPEILTRELHGRLRCLGAPAEGFYIFEIPRSDGPDLFDEIQRDVGDAMQWRRERHSFHLFAHCVEHSGMAVAERRHKYAADR